MPPSALAHFSSALTSGCQKEFLQDPNLMQHNFILTNYIFQVMSYSEVLGEMNILLHQDPYCSTFFMKQHSLLKTVCMLYGHMTL